MEDRPGDDSGPSRQGSRARGVQIRVYHACLHGLRRNAYLQIGAELGVPALIIFVLLIVFSWIDLLKAEKLFLKKGDLLFAGLSLSLRLGLLGFIVSAVFLTQAFLTMFWIILPLAVVAKIFAREDAGKYASA